MTAPAIVYRLRQDDVNEQLRYSLRSLANIEHGPVYVVGHRPPWLVNVEHIAGSRARGKWRQGIEHLAKLCRALTGQTVLLLDDDMYLMQPVESIPAMHAPGRLLDQAFAKGGSYGRSLRQTDLWLRLRGIEQPLSYELHMPMPIDCSIAAPLVESALLSPFPLQGRSVYGNLARLDSVEVNDVKLLPASQHEGPLASSTAVSGQADWRHWRRVLDQRFPVPSSFER